MDIVGKTLGNRYTILEEISGGGMATVYKAKCSVLNRIVAIKILKPEFANDEEFVRRFRREAQAAASLSHPNIVGIYDVGEEDGLYYIVMEYVEGITLKEYIKQNFPIPIADVLEMGIQICDALECAHKNKIIHRDIKSQNIMITNDGRIKVTDFGIARAADGATITNSNNMFGSVQYFSPEQAKSDIVDERSDIYSLGVVLYEAFTGQLPFTGQTPVAIALKHIQEKPPLISQFIPGFPYELERIVQKCLAKSPDDRYQSAKMLRDDLIRALTNENIINFVSAPNVENTMVIDNLKDTLTTAANSGHKSDVSKPKKSRNILKGIGIALALVILFGIFSYAGTFLAKKYLEVQEVTVPSVVGMTEEEAIAEIEKQKLEAKVVDRVFDKAPAGQVISQDPEGGQKVKVNRPPIELVVSKGPKATTVPNVIGLSEEKGLEALKNKGLEARIILENSTEPEGTIIDQNPKEGFTLSEGESVDLTISVGPETITMPNLIGKTLDAAKALLNENDIAVGSVSEKHDQAPANTVIDQNPKAGASVSPGASVTLVVSSGPVETKQIVVGPILLPSDVEETTVKIVVSDELGENRTAYLKKHKAEESPLNITIEGAGQMNIEVWLDDILYYKGTK